MDSSFSLVHKQEVKPTPPRITESISYDYGNLQHEE